jgi:hypothetical protein
MSGFTSVRVALLAGAAAIFTTACSKDAGTAAGPNLSGPKNDVVIVEQRPSAGTIGVCINPSSPPGNYVVTASGTAPSPSVGTATSPVTITLPGPACDTVFRRSNPQIPIDPQNAVTVTVTPPSGAAIVGVLCVLDAGTTLASDCTEPDGSPAIDAVVNLNAFHGTEVTFTFGPAQTAIPLFVIGDVEPHAINDHVYFWGSQWWKNNDMSGFVAKGVASFKGYATESGTCGDNWVSRVGNSPPPPSSIAPVIGLIVTSNVNKSGPDIGGRIQQIVLVNTDDGYGPNPGHAGTGQVISVVCTLQRD